MAEDEVAGQVSRDREAIEAIVGHRISGPWPVEALPVGTRVRVIKADDWDGPWQSVFEGTIDATITPTAPSNAHARPTELEYSVAFDEPQFSTDGLGPYRKAVIWDRYLIPLSDLPAH